MCDLYALTVPINLVTGTTGVDRGPYSSFSCFVIHNNEREKKNKTQCYFMQLYYDQHVRKKKYAEGLSRWSGLLFTLLV